ncbi:MAG: ribose-phosphate diphosphokinase [Gammaproteobacteria bacterium]|nr:ribose-phosphate diphosphokinase [Gammaproteobacteria bacterium]
MPESKHLLVLGFPDYSDQANRLAGALDSACKIVDVHRFPDGESRVRLPENVPAHVVFCRSLNQPNDKLVELMLAACTARELGARRLTLVAPYLCYMRQDTAFVPGEAVSQTIVGDWLGSLFDRVVTVDPHLHRTDNLEAVLPGTDAVALSAAPAMSEYLKHLPESPLLIGPDGESRQWVEQIADLSGVEFAVASKQRSGDRDVEVTLPDSGCEDRNVVLVDDIISTGETMAAAARLARAEGAAEVHCLVTHALFCEGALALLETAGAAGVVSTDSITHESNRIHLAPLLAEAVS